MGAKIRTIYFVFFVITFFTSSSIGQSIDNSNVISAVSGESWLQHLYRSFDETSMGKTGRLGPPASLQQTIAPQSVHSSQTVILSGADLYRLNCRGCHGESGAGAPPEINSVINPVRATSVAAIVARMKNAGAEITRADATKLAEQSKTMLLQRLHSGGQDMPAFPQLTAADIKVLTGYLKQLAEVPGAEKERGSVQAPRLRVGELIVKSTCHTCHSATGENPTPRELSDGAIPPLSALTSRVNRAEFIRKITNGAPVIMGEPALLYRGRMPVFYYLTEEEAADAYEYLQTYPPTQAKNEKAMIALSQSPAVVGDDPPYTPALPASGVPTSPKADSGTNDRTILSIIGLLTMLLLAGGAALTVREMKRLAAKPSNSETMSRDYPQAPVSSLQRDLVA